MIKGCRKNVVYVRNTGSDIFEEAYFIVSEIGSQKKLSEADMVRAASAVIDASPVVSYYSNEKSEKTKNKRSAKPFIWFLFGACVMSGMNMLIMLIF